MENRRVFQGGERTMILRVLRFFEEEKRLGEACISVDQVMRRTCMATGVSLRTINRIKKEEMKALQELSSSDPSSSDPLAQPTSSFVPGSLTTSIIPSFNVVQLTTPGLRRPRAKKKFDIDEATLNGLRDIITRFKNSKKFFTLDKILAAAKSELNYPGQKGTLRRVLKEKIGFTFGKKVNGKKPPPIKIKQEIVQPEYQEDKILEVRQDLWIEVKREVEED